MTTKPTKDAILAAMRTAQLDPTQSARSNIIKLIEALVLGLNQPPPFGWTQLAPKVLEEAGCPPVDGNSLRWHLAKLRAEVFECDIRVLDIIAPE